MLSTETGHATFSTQQSQYWCVLQGKNYIYSIKQTYRPVNPEGCSVIASKTKKNILITIAVRLMHKAECLLFCLHRLSCDCCDCPCCLLFVCDHVYLLAACITGCFWCQTFQGSTASAANCESLRCSAVVCKLVAQSDVHGQSVWLQKANSVTQEEKHWRDLER